MEKKLKLDYDGQAVTEGDFDLLGEVSGLADDRVYAELFRMKPFDGTNVSRGILRTGHTASGTTALVAPNGASGSVLVSPFRAFIGSRTAAGTDAQKTWRDVRSGLSVAAGDTSLTKSVSIAANSSGNPRWDLVYVQVAIEANGPTTSRFVKDPSTGVVAAQSISQYAVNTITVSVVQGTAAASPVWPAAPTDSGSNFYISLAYVRVPNGFSASSTVLTKDIATIAPVLRLASAVGGNPVSPADSHSTISTARQQAWGSSGNRPNIFMPSTMVGGETLFCYFDFSSATSSNWSHQDGDVVDSRDWRGRLCRVQYMFRGFSGTYGNANDTNPAWNTAAAQQGFPNPDPTLSYVQARGLTNSFIGFAFAHSINTRSGDTVSYLVEEDASQFANLTHQVRLYVDHADSGKLKVGLPNGDPGRVHALFWLDFTGPFANK